LVVWVVVVVVEVFNEIQGLELNFHEITA